MMSLLLDHGLRVSELAQPNASRTSTGKQNNWPGIGRRLAKIRSTHFEAEPGIT